MDGVNMPRRPARSVQEIVQEADKFEFFTNIPFKYWIRAAETLYQEGRQALRDEDYERAYLLLYRHSILVIDRLRTHPEFHAHRKEVATLHDRQDAVFDHLERIKPHIKRDYEEWARAVQVENEKAKDRQRNESQFRNSGSFARHPAELRTTTRGFGIRVLSAAENQDLAVDLARQEMDKRARRRGGDWQAFDHASPVPPASDEVDYRSHMESARNQLDFRDRRRSAGTRTPVRSRISDGALDRRPATPVKSESIFDYPPVLRPGYGSQSSKPSGTVDRQQPPPHPPKELAPRPLQAPLIPRKEPLLPVSPSHSRDLSSPAGPMRPPKELPTTTHETPSAPITTPALLSSNLSVPSKKERVSFQPSAHLENGAPLRPVFLPADLRPKFLDLADGNTRRGLEMCGILCGSPVNDALFVTTLLIPNQKCTSDTCETEDEDLTLAYCLENDLIMVGWIHTHPTQSCFMSSRDLHTHAGYQVMMPESIAIVCAPRSTPSYGIFRLTRPPGLDHLLSCTRKETFHPHDVDNLYRNAERPDGHVYESYKLPLVVHDLRTNFF